MSPKLTLCGAVVLFLALPACGSNTSSAPTPQPTPTVRPAITITSISVSSEKQSTGYAYRAIVGLKESAGVAATISSVDLAFISGTSVLVSQHDKPISDSSNVVPANGSIATKELMTVDADASHSVATTVRAQVAFTDGTSFTGTATGTADVPAPIALEPQAFTLTGVITDVGTRAGIEGARLEIVSGANTGKTATTDRSGAYTIRELAAGNFRLRASATGYDAGEQGVTVPANPRADFELRRSGSTAPCVYSVAPSGRVNIPFSPPGTLSVTMTRTSGSCAWQASTDVSWLTLGSASGNGDSTLSVSYRPNASFIGRVGTVFIDWSGGRAQLSVIQGAELPAFCRVVTLTVNGQSTISVPASGGQFTASITPEPGTPPGACGAWTASASPGITVTPPNSGPTPGSVAFTVSANTTGLSRTLSVTVSISGGPPSLTLTVNQSP